VTEHISRHIIPSPPPEVDLLEPYRDTHAFYQEVELRQAFNHYCQWYYQIAEQNRRDLETMRQEFNIMGLFSRKR